MAYLRDRLSELRHSSAPAQHTPEQHQPRDSECAPGEDEEQPLYGFLGTVDELTRYVNEISLKAEKIKRNQNVMLATLQNQEAKDENTRLMNEVKKISYQVHAELRHLKEEIATEEQGPARNTDDFRIKKAQYTNLTRKFHDVMGEYNQVQEDYREKCKERIQRQLRFTGKTVTEEDVEEMLESDNVGIFTQDILIDTSQKRQAPALGEIEAKQLEIMYLEQTIRECHEMLYDLPALVEEQGELIDHIEHDVENAVVHTGRKEIRTAIQYQKNTRLKWIICIVVTVVIVVILVIVAIIVAVVVGMQNQ